MAEEEGDSVELRRIRVPFGDDGFGVNDGLFHGRRQGRVIAGRRESPAGGVGKGRRGVEGFRRRGVREAKELFDVH